MYPTMEQVEQASHIQLARWHRFLNSPGWNATHLSREEFKKVMEKELAIMNRIQERFNELGGMTPAISKAIGWG